MVGQMRVWSKDGRAGATSVADLVFTGKNN